MAADPKALFVLVGILVPPFISVLSVYPHQMHSARCSSLAVTTVHNALFVQLDPPVSKMALYTLQGDKLSPCINRV